MPEQTNQFTFPMPVAEPALTNEQKLKAREATAFAWAPNQANQVLETQEVRTATTDINTYTSAQRSALRQLNTQISATTKQIADTDAKITDVQGQITSLETRANTLRGEISSLTTQTTEIQRQIEERQKQPVNPPTGGQSGSGMAQPAAPVPTTPAPFEVNQHHDFLASEIRQLTEQTNKLSTKPGSGEAGYRDSLLVSLNQAKDQLKSLQDVYARNNWHR